MSRLAIRASVCLTAQGTRPVQEDFALSDPARGIFAVADGFGGGGPGTAAAKVACEEVRHFLFKEAGDLDATLPFVLRSYFSLAGNVLFNALIFANRKLQKLNAGKNAHDKGGASLIAGFVDGDLVALANVGACSAVLIRSGQARELVLPRTYGRMVDPFCSIPPEAGAQVDAPLMALGMADDLEPEICEYRVRPGDWLVLHSDGVGAGFASQLGSLQQQGLPEEEALAEIRKIFEAQVLVDNASVSVAII